MWELVRLVLVVVVLDDAFDASAILHDSSWCDTDDHVGSEPHRTMSDEV